MGVTSHDILGCLENMLVALYGCSIRTLLIDSRIHESPNHSPLSMNHAMFAFTSLGTESSPVSELKMQCSAYRVKPAPLGPEHSNYFPFPFDIERLRVPSSNSGLAAP